MAAKDARAVGMATFMDWTWINSWDTPIVLIKGMVIAGMVTKAWQLRAW